MTWLLTLGLCTFLVNYTYVQTALANRGIDFLPASFQGVQIFFVSLPGWFVAAALYLVLSAVYQRRLDTWEQKIATGENA